MRLFYQMIFFVGLIIVLILSTIQSIQTNTNEEQISEKVKKTEDEWREILSPDRYHIMRENGTEQAFSGQYYTYKEKGIYKCAGCGNELFSSETKYESGSGWPSFWALISEDRIDTRMDKSFFMRRNEILCSRCGGHLGHVFNDGPQPTGMRYCINSLSLDFESEMEPE